MGTPSQELCPDIKKYTLDDDKTVKLYVPQSNRVTLITDLTVEEEEEEEEIVKFQLYLEEARKVA